jgi:hypothetical protein
VKQKPCQLHKKITNLATNYYFLRSIVPSADTLFMTHSIVCLYVVLVNLIIKNTNLPYFVPPKGTAMVLFEPSIIPNINMKYNTMPFLPNGVSRWKGVCCNLKQKHESNIYEEKHYSLVNCNFPCNMT